MKKILIIALFCTSFMLNAMDIAQALYDRKKYSVQLITLLEAACAQGSAQAAYLLGNCYRAGHGVEPNTERAHLYWQQSVAQDHAPACYRLGLDYLAIGHVPEAIQLLEQAAYRPCINKTTSTGARELKDQSYNPAVYMLEQLAQGYSGKAIQEYVLNRPAQTNSPLAIIYKEACALASKHDYAQAGKLLRSCAHQGYAPACSMLALFYEQGLGTARNVRKAHAYYKQAAQNEYPPAQYAYATQVLVHTDHELCTHMLESAAQHGCKAAQNYRAAYNPLHMASYIACGKQLDSKELYEYCKGREQQPEAAQALGCLYRYGYGTAEKDLDKAACYYARIRNHPLYGVHARSILITLADQHSIIAQALAELYDDRYKHELGIFVTHVMEQVVTSNSKKLAGLIFDSGIWSYVRKLAHKQQWQAAYLVGMIYKEDLLPAGKNLPKAVYYLKLAADNGYARACFQLARCYAQGLGVPVTQEAALNYYAHAALNARMSCTTEHDMYAGALAFLEQACQEGSLVAQCWLIALYGRSNIPKEKERAFYLCYELTAQTLTKNRQESVYQAIVKTSLLSMLRMRLEGYKEGGAAFLLSGLYLYVPELRDVDRALTYLQQGSVLGDTNAQAALGNRLIMGNGIPQNIAQGVVLLEKSCAQKNIHAAYHLGKLLEEGVHIPQNRARAHELLTWAADNGSASAQRYNRMQEIKKSDSPEFMIKTVVDLHEAADHGDPEAHYFLSAMNYYGFAIPVDYTKAREHAQAAVQLGYSPAYSLLGRLYHAGQGGLPRDLDQAEQCYVRVIDQEEGEVAWLLAELYLDQGKFSKALPLYEQLSQAKDPNADLRIASMYIQGCGLPKDIKKATTYFNKAFNHGLKLEAMNPADHLITLAMFKILVVQIIISSLVNNYQHKCMLEVLNAHIPLIELLEREAEKGDIKVHFALGCCYYYGYTTARDYTKARLYLEKSGDSCRFSYLILGRIYACGEGTAINLDTALNYYKKALAAGVPPALWEMAETYWRKSDYAHALEIYQKLAHDHHYKSQVRLAQACFHGYGVKKDAEKALGYSVLAITDGCSAKLSDPAYKKLLHDLVVQALEALEVMTKINPKRFKELQLQGTFVLDTLKESLDK